MAEPTPDSKPRSAFLPIMLLIVGLLGVVGGLAPVMECSSCRGLGFITVEEIQEHVNPGMEGDFLEIARLGKMEPEDLYQQCEYCNASGLISIYKRVTIDDATNLTLVIDLDEDTARQILEARQSTP